MPVKSNPELGRKRNLVADLLKMAAEPTRARIILHLADGPMDHEQFAAIIPEQRTQAIQSHIRRMRMAGVVESWRSGRRMVFALTERGRLLLGAIRVIGGGG